MATVVMVTVGTVMATGISTSGHGHGHAGQKHASCRALHEGRVGRNRYRYALIGVGISVAILAAVQLLGLRIGPVRHSRSRRRRRALTSGTLPQNPPFECQPKRDLPRLCSKPISTVRESDRAESGLRTV